jgi:hypothetical protein
MLTDASEARVCSRCSIGLHEIVNCWSRKDGHDLGLQTKEFNLSTVGSLLRTKKRLLLLRT